MSKTKLGFAVCGSFCTFEKTLALLETLCREYDVTPILSEAAASTDTRFGDAAPFCQKVEALTGKTIISSITGAEPIGPKGLLDIILVAPCTGNTLAKLSTGIADTSVTMACKAHLRNQSPVVLAVSTNDGLAGNARNIGTMLNKKHVFFVPFRQDDPKGKPASLVSDFSLAGKALQMAMEGEQLQPLLTGI